MSMSRFLVRLVGHAFWGGRARGGEAQEPGTRPISTPVAVTAAEFLGRPASAYRFAQRPAVIGYVDRDGQPSARAVTFDEVFDQNDRRYLGGYCHERFERRHFRLDRIAFMRRTDTGEHVDPAHEVSRWIGQA